MAETESTDQKQSGTEQQRGLPIEPGEEIQRLPMHRLVQGQYLRFQINNQLPTRMSLFRNPQI